jgi:hypothetical protein
VSLIGLWVRSDEWHDAFWRTNANNNVTGMSSSAGTIVIETLQLAPGTDSAGWHFRTQPADKKYQGFMWKSSVAYNLVGIPTWFLLILSVALAVPPWIHWSSRFSLRTLLIATTLVAVGLGLIVWLR